MKSTLVSVRNNSNQVLGSHVCNTETKNPTKSIAKFVRLTIISFILVSFCSCARNAESGCGTWPMANSHGHKVNKGVKNNQPSLKNNKQYAYYKRYN